MSQDLGMSSFGEHPAHPLGPGWFSKKVKAQSKGSPNPNLPSNPARAARLTSLMAQITELEADLQPFGSHFTDDLPLGVREAKARLDRLRAELQVYWTPHPEIDPSPSLEEEVPRGEAEPPVAAESPLASEDSSSFPFPPADSAEFQRFRKLVDAAIDYAPPRKSLRMLEAILSERLRHEFHVVATRPEWMRRSLEHKADVQLLELLKANSDHLGRSSTIRQRFGIALSSLHRDNASGRIIAYRPTEKDDFLYPFEQFANGRVEEWAAEVVGAVGNGGPALHFLYVPRKQLGGRSFAQALREPADSGVVGLIRKTVARLTED